MYGCGYFSAIFSCVLRGFLTTLRIYLPQLQADCHVVEVNRVAVQNRVVQTIWWGNWPIETGAENFSATGTGTVSKFAGGAYGNYCVRGVVCPYSVRMFLVRSGPNKELNFLSVSPSIQDTLQELFSFSTGQEYKIKNNATVRKIHYLFGYGIYPDWTLGANPIHHPPNETEQV